MFSPDQLVVYPAQGVGVVERIESKPIGDSVMELYIVRIFGNGITLMVPVTNAKNVGLRGLCSKAECEAVLKSLEDRSDISSYTGQNWNRRHREYSEHLKTGKIEDSCKVLKDLLLISGGKDLSFGERRLLEQALSLVSTEIACVLEREQEDVKLEIENLFADLLVNKEEK